MFWPEVGLVLTCPWVRPAEPFCAWGFPRSWILFRSIKFIESSPDFPISSAVITQGKVLEAVVTGIPDGATRPIEGGAAAEMQEIFRQLDAILVGAGLAKTHVASVRLYLQHVNRDIAEINVVYRDYFGAHPPCRRAYGVDLQVGMLVEAAFVAEFPG